MVLWPFFGLAGPMRKKPPSSSPVAIGINCTQVAAAIRRMNSWRAVSEDGLVVIADIASSRILPVAPPGHGPVTALAWSMDGTQLAIGTGERVRRARRFRPAAMIRSRLP